MPPRSNLLGWVRALVVGLALIVGASACDRGAPTVAPVSSLAPAAAPAAPTELVVFAAASLREPFQAIGEQLVNAHAGLRIAYNFAGSQELRTQLDNGAHADVFASADQANMAPLEKAGRVGAAMAFARNQLVIAVAPESATRIRALADLPLAQRIVIGAPEAPIGRYTETVLDNAQRAFGGQFRRAVDAHVVSRELNVKQVLAKVTLGEADAAIVYRSDAVAAKGKVVVVAIPPELNVDASYPIASVTGATNATLGRAFIELVRSPAGQTQLVQAGFLPAAPTFAGP